VTRRSAVFLAKLAVTVGLLAWLLSRADLGRVAASLAGASLPWVLAAEGLHGFGVLVSTWRWRILLRAQGADASPGFLAASLMTGVFFNNFLPSTVGGDVMRARDTAPHAGSLARAATVVLVERVSGVFALGVVALAAPLFGLAFGRGAQGAAVWGTVGLLVAGFALSCLLLRPATLDRVRVRLERFIAAHGATPGPVARALASADRILETLEVFARNPGVMRSTFLLAILLQSNVILHYWCIGQALALPVPLPAYFLIGPVAGVVLLLPVSINGIGAREAVFALLLGAFGVAVAEAVAFSWLVYALLLLNGVIGGVVYALRRRG
jgi:hypothetical protein